MLSIIIPVLNEEEILRQEARYYSQLGRTVDIIFVDGGSKDKTVTLASEFGKVVQAHQGRGHQKNFGAAEADTPYLLFLHIDTIININALSEIIAVLNEGYVAGCFGLSVDDERKIFRLYEWVVNWRARSFGVFDGDLGMFIRKDIFEQLGGFAPMRVMEDIEFSQKLSRHTRIKILDEVISVSSRKWDDKGFWQTFWCYTGNYLKYWLGLDFSLKKGMARDT